MKKRNKRKRSGQRVLSMALSLVLFLQIAPLAAISSYADEVADAAVQTEEPVNEIALETAVPESAPEEMTDAEETGELVTEEPADALEPTEPEETENAEEPEVIQPGTEDTTGGSETVEPEVEENTPEAGQEEPNELPDAPAEGRVEITSAEQLLKGVPAGSTYVLTQNIEMGADQQIGVVAGVLDGAGHTITLNGKPLVGELTGTIQNLLVDGKATQDNGDGSIVRTINGGTLQNCGSTVNIDPGWAFNLGGLAGNVENEKIYNSFFAGNGKDITNVDGVNFVKLICNHPDLTRQGSNSLSWALIALDMNNTQIPADMQWSRERMIAELLSYQNEDGGFGLDKTGGSGIDITAMSLQALARYRNLPEVAEAVEKAVQYLAKAVETNLNLGNSESIAQVIIAMSVLNRDVVTEPGFGDELENLMSVREKYMVEGKGFKHDKNGQVDKMETAQAMQALCAYERFLYGESGYWDLQGTGPVEDPAEKVSGMIAALPDTISAENAASIREARDAYEALTDAQKKRVKNLDRLVKAEQALTELQAVQQVVDAIAALPEEITLANAHEVKAAREAFEKLTVQQQAQVTNLKKLEAAEAAIQALIGADRVQKMIDDLPENITLANESAVQAARAAYELLTPQQQAQVTNVKKLEEAEKKLEALHADQKVQQVVDKIDELPETITLADEKTVQDARTAFDQLTKAQQAQVRNADKLFQAEKAIADQKAVAEVEKMIQDLSDPVTLADKQAVEAARVAYEALTDEQKALVQNLDKLMQAEAGLKDLDAAQKVMNQIKELPVEITAADE